MLFYIKPETEFKLYSEVHLKSGASFSLTLVLLFVTLLMRESLGGSGQGLCLLRDRALSTVKRRRDNTVPHPLFLCLCNDSGSICC